MPTFPSFNLSDVDWSKLDLSKLELPKFEVPKFDLPKFDLPKFDLPELPNVDLPSAEQVAGFVRDAAYVGVGFAVMTAERVQELQKQVAELLKTQLERVRTAV